METPLNNIVLYKNRKEDCSYSILENVGMVPLKNLAVVPGKNLEEKTYGWLNANWMTNMHLTRTLVAIICEYNEGNKLSLSTGSNEAMQAFKGVVRFMQEKHTELSHLIAVYFPNLTLGGRELPPISKEFNNMSYAERQAILRANNEAKLELIEGEK